MHGETTGTTEVQINVNNIQEYRNKPNLLTYAVLVKCNFLHQLTNFRFDLGISSGVVLLSSSTQVAFEGIK